MKMTTTQSCSAFDQNRSSLLKGEMKLTIKLTDSHEVAVSRNFKLAVN